MKLENQVVSLELSKKLKELGVKQESYFVWELFDICPPKLQTATDVRLDQADYYSAFTCSELGEMLPSKITKPRYRHFTLKTFKHNDIWEIGYIALGAGILSEFCCDKNEANARAKLMIYLLEHNLIQK